MNENKLIQTFANLSDQDQASVLAFAEFLLQRAPKPRTPQTIEQPKHIEPSGKESVIKAIKRLSETYSMVDRGSMLNETSNLMTAHMVNGKPALEVIKELTVLFEQQYQNYVDVINKSNTALKNKSL